MEGFPFPRLPTRPSPDPRHPASQQDQKVWKTQALHTASPESVHCQAGQRLRGGNSGS